MILSTSVIFFVGHSQRWSIGTANWLTHRSQISPVSTFLGRLLTAVVLIIRMQSITLRTFGVIYFSSRYLSALGSVSSGSISNRSGSVWELPKLHYLQPNILPVRYKGKSMQKNPAKLISLTEGLKQTIRDEEMIHEYSKVLERFEDDLYGRLCLKLTPEIFYNITIPGERVRLGDVAAIISQTAQPNAIQPTSQILIDLSGRPDLVPAAKTAVSQYISGDSGAPYPKKGKANSSCPDLIQDVDQTRFTVRLRTIVTGDVRDELIKQGRGMLHQTKKNMDKIYQKFSKFITTIKTLSEDDKRTVNEYLKSTVKEQHMKAEQAWKNKEQELLSERM